jgi:Zn-dependent protease with chaperone function
MRIAALAALILLCFLGAASAAAAQQPPAASPAGTVTAASAPVPVPEPGEKALRYYRTGNVLWVVQVLWTLLVPVLLLFTGLSAWMRDRASRAAGGNWLLTTALYGILFSLLSFLLDLPLAWYGDFYRQHAYGLSDQAPAKWWTDTIKTLALGCFFTAVTLWFPYLLLRKSPRRWWLYTGLASIPLLTFLLFISPVWIDPLYNDFGPMKNKALEAKILALAERAGIEGGRVYEVAKSVDTRTVNAYVTGFGSTQRIVLWDTTLAKLKEPEVLFVMGHEMGHYVLGHVWQLIALGCSLILFGLWIIHLTADGLIERFAQRFGFRELGDVASLPLIGLLFSLASLVLSPVGLAIDRHVEHEADRFALEITRDNHDCATAFAKLQQENLAVPRPGLLYKLWRASHPPLGERIDFCNQYRPWETGEPLKYGRLIRR